MRRVLFATVVALLAGITAAWGEPERPRPLADDVTFVNETPARVLHVYIWRQGNTPWLEDALGEQYIEPGRQVRIQVREGDHCFYDFEVEFADQHKVSGTANLCRDPVVRLKP